MPLGFLLYAPPLATSYPIWFVGLAWLFILFPIYPGLIVLAIGIFSRQSNNRAMLLWVGLGLAVAGALVVAFNWDSIRSGNPYHLF